jgi:L-threonylcarbamoyladenylate synthase
MLNHWHLHLAVRHLKAGGLVLHAAEGVWGLACDPFDPQAVQRLLDLKGRPVAKGLIVIGHSADVFSPELELIGDGAKKKVLSSWPGPETWVLPTRRFPPWITGDHSGVAVRVPGHPQARALSAAFGGPLVSTSANPSGRPAPTTLIQSRSRLGERGFPAPGDYVLPGVVQAPGAASRIRTLSGETLRGAPGPGNR